MLLKEETLRSEEVYRGRIFRVEQALVRLPNGREGKRDVVRHPGAVAIIAWADSDTILLVRQYRLAAGCELWEIPAGKLEAGEDPAACAARELVEETGYAPEHLTEITSFYTSPGFSSEILYLYEACGLKVAYGEKDADEFLEVRCVPWRTALEWLKNGEIRDAKTMIALLLTAQRRSA
ncbi:MAG: ADP-ribose pyrophosphatase [Bacillota bacterium]|nr:ADP-ribose pyrophosphatase [Bacillota bacterium]